MDISSMFGQLPTSLRDELLSAFNKIVTNYREGKWEPSELNGGKLCEVVYSILDGYISGKYPQKACKPSNMYDACLALSKTPNSMPRSIRIQIPRVITALYEIRSNRGVGHIGGEVDPNLMDSTMVISSAKWIMSELVRLFHNVDTQTASEAVEALTTKEIQTIWNVNSKKRILNTHLSMKEKTLLLLYSENKSVRESDLIDWTEHKNSSVFRRDILIPGHKSKLWEYDKNSREIILSPLGINIVENKLI